MLTLTFRNVTFVVFPHTIYCLYHIYIIAKTNVSFDWLKITGNYPSPELSTLVWYLKNNAIKTQTKVYLFKLHRSNVLNCESIHEP